MVSPAEGQVELFPPTDVVFQGDRSGVMLSPVRIAFQLGQERTAYNGHYAGTDYEIVPDGSGYELRASGGSVVGALPERFWRAGPYTVTLGDVEELSVAEHSIDWVNRIDLAVLPFFGGFVFGSMVDLLLCPFVLAGAEIKRSKRVFG